ncbi:ATP-dependent DNA helicase RecG, partial [Candidatus Saccharibacteria bacterium]|nr:ATP-dependent DNA helicase RecG [Candidatus Saccharibacteria bacterium]
RVVGSLLIEFKKDIANKFVKSLPFSLTNAQRKAVWQIYQDLAGSTPMNRLLEGDVGSGKTVVACMVTLMVIESGYQVAIMAPTEILARQHAETFRKLLKPLGYGDGVVLLIGSMNVKQKHLAYKSIEDGRAKVVIGTSTLIQEKVTMKNLALVIIDEQHRFGVDQRKKLQRKAGRMPHVLSMTATPIPRSLALVLYGDLDITIVNDKPENRKPVKTCIVLKRDEQKIHDVIKQEVNNGRQAYIVSPIIEEGESATSSSAKQTFNKVQQLFSGVSIGLLHGKLSKEEKERTMQKFQKNEIAILVTTTVIEVGVDIPNATVIVIQDPERFGLAQIHQLRGRVGRADHDSYCFLSLSNNNKPSQRLHALESKHSGFELAELDLELRGPGEIYGITQHGHLDLRMAKLSDTKMISAAKKAAEEFIARKEKLIQYKELHNRVNYLRKITNLN